ncbi:hypothetical protein FLA_4422 [Filimonas lacunae]|nr:hypothetical protein FLA_4422 [Filimonas lacunae]
MHQYLEAIRKISDDLYKYKKLIQRKFKGKAAVIEAIHQNLMVMIMMMAYHWPRFDPLAGRVHLAVIASDMKANRHKWHSIHQQLVARIIDPEIKLVAMNMVRECRPSLDNELCWRRLMYNNHLLDKLQTLLATVDRNIPVDEVFTDSLLYWEYYDEEFICYYIEHIENSIANADSYQDKKELLTHFYNKTDLMQPTEPAFCFHIATDENDSLPPIKDFILQVLDFHSEAIENF